MSEEPFMEHPTGEYANAIDAMEAAIARLRALPDWNRWITFCAQGEGNSPESIHVAEVRVLSDVIEVGSPLDLRRLLSGAKVAPYALASTGANQYSIARAGAREAAQILDTIFRDHLGIRPFADDDEDPDYAVGAEWE